LTKGVLFPRGTLHLREELYPQRGEQRRELRLVGKKEKTFSSSSEELLLHGESPNPKASALGEEESFLFLRDRFLKEKKGVLWSMKKGSGKPVERGRKTSLKSLYEISVRNRSRRVLLFSSVNMDFLFLSMSVLERPISSRLSLHKSFSSFCESTRGA